MEVSMWENQTARDSATELAPDLLAVMGALPDDSGSAPMAAEPVDDGSNGCIVLGYN
jgi:hypothetical protein